MKKRFYLSVLIALLIPRLAAGHGVQVSVEIQPPVVIVTSSYSAAQQLADASVIIHSPAESKKPYQSGRTDISGHFIFMPDREGEWTFYVDDQKGHTKKTVISITTDFFAPGDAKPDVPAIIHDHAPVHMEDHSHDHTHDTIPVIYKVIFGLAMILGLSGFFYGIRAKQSQKK